jgi:hypothetical protein
LIGVVIEELAKIKNKSFAEMEYQVEANFREISRQVGLEPFRPD